MMVELIKRGEGSYELRLPKTKDCCVGDYDDKMKLTNKWNIKKPKGFKSKLRTAKEK